MEYLRSYSLHDLLIFSPESYFKLFELSNTALWPFHLPLIVLALSAIFLGVKRYQFSNRLLLIWLGLVWCFVGYWYFNRYYSQINTIAPTISYLYYAQACLLFIYAYFSKHNANTIHQVSNKKWQSIAGIALIIYGFLIHPFVSLMIWNQPFSRIEMFSISPDPTAIATIGFLLLLAIKANFFLMIIPILSLLLSFLTYQTF